MYGDEHDADVGDHWKQWPGRGGIMCPVFHLSTFQMFQQREGH